MPFCQVKRIRLLGNAPPELDCTMLCSINSATSRSEERRVGKEYRVLCSSMFSSRRRHTIFSRDWSSDVCSSDLVVDGPVHARLAPQAGAALIDEHVATAALAHAVLPGEEDSIARQRAAGARLHDALLHQQRDVEIGRASCREGVSSSVFFDVFKQKTAYDIFT